MVVLSLPSKEGAKPYKERFFNGVPSQNVCYAIKDVL